MFNEIEKTMDAHDKAILNEWMEYARSVSAVEIAHTSHQYSWWKNIEPGTPITAAMGLDDPCVPGIQEDIIEKITSLK